MQRIILNSKIHRVTVTESNLNYVGSISIDRDLMDAANLLDNEQVHVLNISNGARLITYAIPGPRGSGLIGINGAAAHQVAVNDLVIICSYVQFSEAEIKAHRPRVVLVDAKNKVIKDGRLAQLVEHQLDTL